MNLRAAGIIVTWIKSVLTRYSLAHFTAHMAFGCGHQTCYVCGETLKRSSIQTII
ncbi:hypothetical protein HanPI659440_Chr09g0360971 [Helianthus annuus]|nr:hypothetical protein HanPI659440_Chr09g0360971 [Helianthus annuus]